MKQKKQKIQRLPAIHLNHYRLCLRQLRDEFSFRVNYDDCMSMYVDIMYELNTDNKIYSDLYLYQLGYGATLQQDIGVDKAFAWTDSKGNLLKLFSCNSGIFLIRTHDNRWRHVFSSCRIEEAIYKYECQLKNGTHWNKYLQHYYNIEDGNLEIESLELCPKRFLRLAKTKWCQIFNQTMKKSDMINKNFKEEDCI